MEQKAALDAVVTGLVQGVWFRDTTVRRARELGVAGWVRNDADGSVRVHAEGDAGALEQLVAFLHEGPPLAQVEAVRVQPGSVEGHARFRATG